MRLIRHGLNEDEQKESQTFVAWLLDVGNEEHGVPDEEDTEDTTWKNIPLKYCIPTNEEGIMELIDFIYDQETLKKPTTTSLQEKEIACLENKTADRYWQDINALSNGIPKNPQIPRISTTRASTKGWITNNATTEC
nr:DNA helicase [Tanacetum cinerariifolium]